MKTFVKITRELQRNTLVDLEALLHAHIDVPVGRAGDRTNTRVLGIDAQDGSPNLVPYRHRILEHVDGLAAGTGLPGTNGVSKSVSPAADAVVRMHATGVLAGEDTLLV